MDDIVEKLRESRNKYEILLLKEQVQMKINELENKKKDIDLAFDELDDESENLAKRVEYMSQSYASFYNTTLEKDKSMLTLSVAGLGFLVTFINFKLNFGILSLIVLFIAAFSYLVCIHSIVTIFGKNARYIIALTTSNVDVYKKIELELKTLDKRAIRSFYSGIAVSFLLGISVPIYNQFNDQVEKKQPTQETTTMLTKENT
ncbi:TPA: hypothetical protein P0E26_002438 [Vibrio harveyi]|nr:hypothetical protein [Vibrio harveyi]